MVVGGRLAKVRSMWPPSEPVVYPGRGRIFRSARRVRLGDVSPRGRLRLDAFVRYLQDVANDDSMDGDYTDKHAWVVRRTELWVHGFPSYLDDVELATWCGGLGSHWAERRTTLTSVAGARIEAATLWVHVDMDTMRPKPVPPDFPPLVEEATAGRRVRATLTLGRNHPPPGAPGVDERAWQIRMADMDAVGHMNNASYWAAAEEYLGAHRELRAPLHAVTEHLLPVPPMAEVRLLVHLEGDLVFVRHVLADGALAAVSRLGLLPA